MKFRYRIHITNSSIHNGGSLPSVFRAVVFCVLLMLIVTVHAQEREQHLIRAANHWMAGDYMEAADHYRLALRADSSDLQTAFRLAECYRYENRYNEAASVYLHVISLAEAQQVVPDAWFHLAQMMKQKGDMNSFCLFVNDYLRLGRDSVLLVRANRLAMVCHDSSLLPTDTLNVKITHLARTVNTPWSEFAPLQLGDSLLMFSALRPISSSEFQTFAQLDYRSAIYQSKISVSGYSRGRELPGLINKKNTHNANATYDPENQRIFFSRCLDLDNGLMQCRIMTSLQRPNGSWRKPAALPAHINMTGYTNTQPHYTRIGDVGVLYFVSDRPGGLGSMDIWYSIEHDGRFAEPANAGSVINTPGNEVTPFFDTSRALLFFSSDWHHGFGGYDIFSARGGLSAWEKPVNLGVPFNSPANDFYFTVNATDQNGYFTSNRTGSFYMRGETCCNDIYAYEWLAEDTNLPQPPDTPVVEQPDSIALLAQRLLPLMLFFHNDEPDAATMRTTSSKDYRLALDEYNALRMVYRREYSRGLRGEAAEQAVDDIEDFFVDYVQGGYTKLELLTDYLLRDLQAGNTVQLQVSGYCSPLSTNDYNINLARRRIHSLVLYLEKARAGALKPYMTETSTDMPRLLIFEDPIGKEKASPFVSDNPNDLRNSVYSRAAAFERRIEISMYVSQKPGEALLITELPRMVFSQDTIPVEPIQKGNRLVLTIPYKNEGTSELMIRRVEFNGDYLWVEWDNEALLPGRQGKLMVLVNGDIPGEFLQKITIHSNQPDPVEIMVRGAVNE